jgi:hypothetical protein
MLTADQRDDPDEPYEPDQYSDAIYCPDSNKWKTGMMDEYESLMKNETWILTSLPQGRRAIRGRWIYKYKPAANGEAPRYKARFVACGYSQRLGIDYNETYAAVVSHDSFRILKSTVATLDLEMVQLDVKTAFLYGDLEEEIYLEQPEGFVVAGHETEVCRLKRSIYGLKQASHVWSARFSAFLHQQEFKQSDADPCFFIRKRKDETTFLIIYVDDGIIASNQPSSITDLLTALKEEFEIRSYTPGRFVGVNITRNRLQRELYLSQSYCTSEIIHLFHMSTCHPKATPAEPNTHLTLPSAQGEQAESTGIDLYRQVVGSLLYLTLMTRPDISYAVGQVSRFVERHDSSHWKAVRRVISYLRGTVNYGIRFNGSNPGAITGYTNADYAGCPD